jgi:hypothetical protein
LEKWQADAARREQQFEQERAQERRQQQRERRYENIADVRSEVAGLRNEIAALRAEMSERSESTIWAIAESLNCTEGTLQRLAKLEQKVAEQAAARPKFDKFAGEGSRSAELLDLPNPLSYRTQLN